MQPLLLTAEMIVVPGDRVAARRLASRRAKQAHVRADLKRWANDPLVKAVRP
jgi:hypothetical protein